MKQLKNLSVGLRRCSIRGFWKTPIVTCSRSLTPRPDSGAPIMRAEGECGLYSEHADIGDGGGNEMLWPAEGSCTGRGRGQSLSSERCSRVVMILKIARQHATQVTL